MKLEKYLDGFAQALNEEVDALEERLKGFPKEMNDEEMAIYTGGKQAVFFARMIMRSIQKCLTQVQNGHH